MFSIALFFRIKMSGKDFAKNLIESKKVVVISKGYCPFCISAKVGFPPIRT